LQDEEIGEEVESPEGQGPHGSLEVQDHEDSNSHTHISIKNNLLLITEDEKSLEAKF